MTYLVLKRLKITFPKLVVVPRHLKVSNREQNLKIMWQLLLMTRESILSIAYHAASQRDALLLKETKEDREERKEFRDMLKNANDSFVHALNNMSQSMLSISNAIARSMETFSNTAHSRAMPLPYYRLEQQQAEQQQNGYIHLQPARSVFYEGNQ